MKIALVNLTSGGFSGGYRKYLAELIPRLLRHRDVEWLKTFAPPSDALHGDLTWPRRDVFVGYPELRRRIAALKPDVVFIPTQRWFDAGRVPTVIMVRNMEPLEVPFGENALPEALRNLARAHAARRACERADRIIAVSGHVRDFLLRRWNIDRHRIAVVYHGLSETPAASMPASLASFDGPFLFTAGSIRPARGLEDVIAALASLPDVRLVIAGKADGAEAYDARLTALARRLGVANRIVRTGQLNASEMSWCFTHAELFVMTSRAEACPNTALEALAHGTLIVSCDHAPMPEFFRDAACYYRARDTGMLATAIRHCLTLTVEEKRLQRDRAHAIAQDFDWDKTANETLRELRQVIR